MPHELPEGFTAYDGSGCPFDRDVRVEHAILVDVETGRVSVNKPEKTLYHDWEWSKGQPETGDVVGYRIA